MSIKKYEWAELVQLGLKTDPSSRHASSTVRAFLARKGLLEDGEVEVVFPDGKTHRYRPRGVRGGMYQRNTKNTKSGGTPSYNVLTPWGVVNVTPTVELGFDEAAFREAMASLKAIMGEVPPQVEAQIRRACTKTRPVWIVRVSNPEIIKAWGLDAPGEEK